MVHILNHDQFGCGAGVMQQIRLLALLNIPTALVNTGHPPVSISNTAEASMTKSDIQNKYTE